MGPNAKEADCFKVAQLITATQLVTAMSGLSTDSKKALTRSGAYALEVKLEVVSWDFGHSCGNTDGECA